MPTIPDLVQPIDSIGSEILRELCALAQRRMRRTSGRPRRQLLRQLAQQRIRLIPIDARVGNGHAIAQAIRIVDALLVTFVQVTFDHQSRNRTVARRDLLDDRIDHVALLPMILVGVCGGAIHHDRLGKTQFFQRRLTGSNIVRRIIRTVAAAL